MAAGTCSTAATRRAVPFVRTPSPSTRLRCSGSDEGSATSSQLDIAVDLEREVYAADRDDGFRRQPVDVLQPPVRRRLAHRLLDFALRCDAERPEELAHAGVKGFLVHGVLLVRRF